MAGRMPEKSNHKEPIAAGRPLANTWSETGSLQRDVNHEGRHPIYSKGGKPNAPSSRGMGPPRVAPSSFLPSCQRVT